MPKSKNTRKSKGIKVKHRALPIMLRVNQEAELMIQINAHQELFKLENHIPDEKTWHMLTCRINIGSRLSLLFSEDAQRTMVSALNALVSIRDRFTRVSKYGGSQEEIANIHAALNLTDDMQKSTTRRELRDAIHYVFKNFAGA